MNERTKNNMLDYLPVLSFFIFWFQAALGGALYIKDPALIKLGVVTLPAVAAMIAAVVRIHAGHRNRS